MIEYIPHRSRIKFRSIDINVSKISSQEHSSYYRKDCHKGLDTFCNTMDVKMANINLMRTGRTGFSSGLLKLSFLYYYFRLRLCQEQC